MSYTKCVATLWHDGFYCVLHKVCSPITARWDLLCVLHKVCSHIMAERLSRGIESHTSTHCGPIFDLRQELVTRSRPSPCWVNTTVCSCDENRLHYLRF